MNRPSKIVQTSEEDDDPCSVIKNEHNNNLAREQILKGLSSFCLLDYNKMVSAENQTKTQGEIGENNFAEKLNTNNFSQNFVNLLLKQMNHYDFRKKKFHQIKNQIWTNFVHDSINDLYDTKSHVKNLCEQYKIYL